MTLKPITALLPLLFVLGSYASNTVARDALSDELYVSEGSDGGGAAFREIFIAPLNLAQLQVIQPEGAEADAQWIITDDENELLQNAMVTEFTAQLSYESAYNVVNRRADADMVVHTSAVAITPYTTRAEIAAGAKPAGAITISLALVNAETGKVMVRSVDTRSTENIWAFNQVGNEETAVNLIFRAWGNSMRRGMLALQGRTSIPGDDT